MPTHKKNMYREIFSVTFGNLFFSFNFPDFGSGMCAITKTTLEELSGEQEREAYDT